MSVNGPVFVVVPAAGTLPVPVQPTHTYWLVPLATGEPMAAVSELPQLYQCAPAAGLAVP